MTTQLQLINIIISTNRSTAPGIFHSVTYRGQRSASHSSTCCTWACVVPRVSPNGLENTTISCLLRLVPQALHIKTDGNEVTTGPTYRLTEMMESQVLRIQTDGLDGVKSITYTDWRTWWSQKHYVYRLTDMMESQALRIQTDGHDEVKRITYIDWRTWWSQKHYVHRLTDMMESKALRI